MDRNPEGHGWFRCRDCRRVFLRTCIWAARKPGISEPVTEMAFSGAGVRDTAGTLKTGINTVIRTLKNSCRSESPVAYADVTFICEPDEQWGFVLSAVKPGALAPVCSSVELHE